MGGTESRLEATDWDTANGGMAGDAKCMAGNTPTHGKKTITLKKCHLTNFRLYDIFDDKGNEILKFKEEASTRKYFEAIAPTNSTAPGKWQFLSRAIEIGDEKSNVVTQLVKHHWVLYSYVQPAFEGQQADPQARRAAFEDSVNMSMPLYRWYEIKFDSSKNCATVRPYVKDPTGLDQCGVAGDEISKVEKVKGKKEIYQVSLPDADTLVAYWNWENTLTEHKIVLQLAEGMDIGLYSMLAVIANIVKETEKNPLGIITN